LAPDERKAEWDPKGAAPLQFGNSVQKFRNQGGL